MHSSCSITENTWRLFFTLELLYIFLFLSVFSKIRFRWFQESSVHRDVPAFALDGVYISEPCPNHCGGHGDCISGVCFCDMGYTGNWTSLQRYTYITVIIIMYFICNALFLAPKPYKKKNIKTSLSHLFKMFQSISYCERGCIS